ncbi:MAG: TonB-dependent receptor plug domain-containing protein [Saprospiraceae bacterium]|nr:TonB-dependent receptor plug domain-containing protein [Candidatus Vicinibacter affinis]
MKKSAILITIFSIAAFANAQQNDTVKKIDLKEVIIQDYKTLSEMARMPDVKENVIYAGKKTEVIQLDRINADLSTNNTRQVFAKVPGMSIWENDGSGIQAGVATRGLSPNRSWEFNVRQNGYDISSEVFGYPETYYTPPMEALVKIEVIRGASSLQYGPQFGGLLNYQIKKGNPNKAISYETQQTVGSYGLFNTYHAIGERTKIFPITDSYIIVVLMGGVITVATIFKRYIFPPTISCQKK